MILTITLNPSIDRTLYLEKLVPYDTNRVLSVEEDAGGKGLNVSRIVQNSRGQTKALIFLGGATGQFIAKVLTNECVPFQKVLIHNESRINISIEDATGNPPTSVNPIGPEIFPEEWEEFCEQYKEACKGASWVVLSGSVPQAIPRNAYAILGKWAKEADAKVALDADGDALTFGLECGPDLIKPNQFEAARWLGHPVETFEDAVKASHEMLERLTKLGSKNPICLLSRGKDGAILTSKDQGDFHGTSPGIVSQSTVGAGDSMVGGFLCSLQRGEDLSTALQWGLASGAATATTDGTKIGPIHVIELLFSEANVKSLG